MDRGEPFGFKATFKPGPPSSLALVKTELNRDPGRAATNLSLVDALTVDDAEPPPGGQAGGLSQLRLTTPPPPPVPPSMPPASVLPSAPPQSGASAQAAQALSAVI